jgi:ATP adenylyltransferase
MWSPWRMDYVAGGEERASGKPACVFCDLPAQHDDARTYILYRGERAFVVMNLYPYNSGHLMMVPYAHEASLAGLDEPTLTELMTLAKRSQSILEERMRPQGFNLGVNQGRAGGAGIADHFHMHLLPRWVGDTNFMPALGDVRVMPQHLDETYRLLADGFTA